MTGVRWSRTDGIEGKCDGCCQWWPLGEDFLDYWLPQRGLRICRACQRERTAGRLRSWRKKYYMEPERLEARRRYQREYMRVRRALERAA